MASYAYVLFLFAATFTDSTVSGDDFPVVADGTYSNPVINADHPDPGVIYHGPTEKFFAVTTSGNAANRFPIMESQNLVNWTLVGHIFPNNSVTAPTWAASDFWAPEIHQISPGHFNAYFVARNHKGVLSIGVASADSPKGPWTDSGKPLITDPKLGNIDATFYQENGTNYLIWKLDGNGAVPPQGTPIFLQELSADGLNIASGSDKITLITKDRAFEGPLVEAPWIVKRNEYYYLFYSCNFFSSPTYSISVARSLRLEGPYDKIGYPVMMTGQPAGKFSGPGHCSVLPPISNVTNEFYMIYHGWHTGDIAKPGAFRAMLVDKMVWNSTTGWPTVGNHDVPTSGPQPIPTYH